MKDLLRKRIREKVYKRFRRLAKKRFGNETFYNSPDCKIDGLTFNQFVEREYQKELFELTEEEKQTIKQETPSDYEKEQEFQRELGENIRTLNRINRGFWSDSREEYEQASKREDDELKEWISEQGWTYAVCRRCGRVQCICDQ